MFFVADNTKSNQNASIFYSRRNTVPLKKMGLLKKRASTLFHIARLCCIRIFAKKQKLLSAVGDLKRSLIPFYVSSNPII
jgi:hypothetical protein